MYSDDVRWRIVTLIHVYDIDLHFLSEIFGPKVRSIQRWYNKFLKTGTVCDNKRAVRASRWLPHIVNAVERYVQAHPTFYIKELKVYN